MSILISCIVFALSATFGNGCASASTHAVETQKPAGEEQLPEISRLADLVAKPETYGDQPIRVRGKLENAGKNFFTDRRIALNDGKGHSLEVRPWLPLSRPGPSSGTRSGPTLADYLDQQVEIVGSLTRRTEPDRKPDYILQVKSAKVVDF
jgi:hypothetical protein